MAQIALLTGATGLIGGHLLAALSDDPAYDKVIVLARSVAPSALADKVDWRVCDLLDATAVKAALANDRIDVGFCALGTTHAKAGSNEAFYAVDHDAVINVAHAAKANGANRFLTVSSVGATASSGNNYVRTKGETERDLNAIGFEALHIFRPGLLLGKRSETRLAEGLGQVIAPVFNLLLHGPATRYRSIEGETVAKAMVADALQPFFLPSRAPRARNWLDDKGVAFEFHDFRKDGLNESDLRGWVDQHGLEVVLNKRGTTFRKLPDDVKDNLTEESAIALMLEQPAMIKRPVFDLGNDASRISTAPGKNIFVWYAIAAATWFMAGGLMGVIFPWLIAVELQSSPEMVSFAVMSGMLPQLFLLMFGGVVADRFDLKRLLVVLYALSALPPLAMAYVLWQDMATYILLIAFSLLGGVLGAFVMPARDAMLTNVAKGPIQQAVALMTMMQFGGQLAGTAMAGFAETIGPVPFILGQSALILVGVFCYFQIPNVPPQPGARDKSPLADIKEGLIAVKDTPEILTLMLVMSGTGIFYIGTFMVGFPLMARDVYNGGSAEMSYMQMGFTAGTIAGSMFLFRFLPPIKRPGRFLMSTSVLSLVFLLGLASAPPLWVTVTLMGLWGFSAGMSMSVNRTVVQVLARPELRARMLATFSLTMMGVGPIGALLMGQVIERIGILNSFLIPPAATIVVMTLAFFFSPMWTMEVDDQPNDPMKAKLEQDQTEKQPLMTQFRWYLASTIGGNLSGGLGTVIGPWIVVIYLNETPERVGLLQFAGMVPSMFMLLFAGAIADKYDPRKILITVQFLLFFPSALMAAAIYYDFLTYGLLIANGFIGALIGSFAMPSRDAILSHVVKGTMQRAVAFINLMGFGSMAVGIVAAGITNEQNAHWMLLLQGFLVLSGMISIMQLKNFHRPQTGPPKSALRMVGDGMKATFRNKLIFRMTTIVTLRGMFYGGAFSVALPIIAREIYDGGAAELSAIQVAFMGTTMIASMFLIRFGPVQYPGRFLIFSSLVSISTMVIIAQGVPFWGFVASMAAWGISGGISMNLQRAIMQEAADPAYRARMLSVFHMSQTGAAPFGAVITGVLIEATDPLTALYLPAGVSGH
ncbi:yraR [Symbiodinium microadriaticum]|nr:yraR [Symbiodinium microadriaticum]